MIAIHLVLTCFVKLKTLQKMSKKALITRNMSVDIP